MKTGACITILLVLLYLDATAQIEGEEPVLIGIAPGAVMRWQQATVRTCSEEDCLPFLDGSGMGYAIGLRGQYRMTSTLFLRAGIAWERSTSDFVTTKRNYPILGEGNRVERVDLENELRVRMTSVNVDLGLAYRILDAGLYLTGGPVLVLPLESRWEQTERILAPSGVQYAGGGREKTLLESEIPDLQSSLAVRIGAAAMFPLSARLVLAPELTYTQPLGALHAGFDWTSAGIDLSVAVMMRF